MTMAEHVRILGILYIVFNLLELLVAAFVFAVLVGGGFLASIFSGGPEPFTITVLVGMAISFFLVLIGAPGLIGGLGLLRYKSWARILVLVIGILGLFNVPLGTLLGVYTLWVLLNPESESLFSRAG